MKKTMLIMSCCLLLFMSKGKVQIVGNMDDQGNAMLTFSAEKILDSWNEMLQNSGFETELSEIMIEKAEGNYYLIARSGTYQSGTLLKADLKSNNLALPEGVKTVCVSKTTDGKEACKPKNEGGCAAGKGNGDCTKISSTSTYLF